MLSVMLDQIRFSAAAFALDTVETRYRRLLDDLGYGAKERDLASAALKFGRIDRGDAPVVLRTSERTARNALSGLVKAGFLRSATPKGPVRIAFPVAHRDRLFPSLFGDAAIQAPDPPATASGR